MNRMTKGGLFVISGPSGVGKSSVVKRILEINPDASLSISATTRKIRENEAEGINYYYKTKDEFKQMIQNNEFMEWAEFCDNFYGTPASAVMEKLNAGTDVILEIETCGAMKIMDKYPQAVSIFILPPSLEILEERIRGRGTESEDVIRKRLSVAEKEIGLAPKYTYNIINDVVDEAAKNIVHIMKAESFKTIRNNMKYN